MQDARILYLANLDWFGLNNRTQHLARHLARRNHVLWAYCRYVRDWQHLPPSERWRALWSASAQRDGVRFYELIFWRPRRLPMFEAQQGPWFARRLAAHTQRAGFAPDVLWVTQPAHAALADLFPDALLCYDWMDAYADFFTGARREAIAWAEEALLRRADLVLATSQGLLERTQAVARRAVLVPNGVQADHFFQAMDHALPRPADLAGLPEPLIGYYGTISWWMDWELLSRLGEMRPRWSFVLIGTIRARPPALPANIHLLGRRPYAALPAYLRHIPVWLYPFAPNDLVQQVDPLKLYEYIAAGRRIVATRTRETGKFGDLIAPAEGAEAFAAAIEAGLAAPLSAEEYARARAFAEQHTWERRGQQIEALLDEALAARRGHGR
ncbi:MAG: glycosyltransferase [Chloroflexota bacterium]